MSRSERRAYKRMMKNQDPYALPAGPAQRAKLQQRQRARRSRGGEFRFVSGRFLAWALGGAFAAGLLAFSLAWPKMPLAAYVGVGAIAAWLTLAWLARSLQARAAARPR